MATSGTTDFNLSIDDLVEEAFERCGMQMTAGYQLNSARRSLNLLFLDWANRGLNLWTIEQATKALVQGDSVVDLPTDTVNVLTAVIRQTTNGQQQDISIERIGREEYLNVPNKLTQARPSQIYIERTSVPKAYLYPAADKAYTLVYYRIRRMDDAGTLASGLAYMLSLKYSPDRTAALQQMYEQDFTRAAQEDRDTASTRILPDVGS